MTRIKFGGMQQNILAYVSIDKTLTIIDLTDDMKPNPKPVVLKGIFLKDQ